MNCLPDYGVHLFPSEGEYPRICLCAMIVHVAPEYVQTLEEFAHVADDEPFSRDFR